MSQVKAAILVGGPLDGKSVEIDVNLHGYLQLVYDTDLQAEFAFTEQPKEKATHRIATYQEMPDGTHWKYYSG